MIALPGDDGGESLTASFPALIFSSGTGLMAGSESFLSATFFLMTDVGVKARGEAEAVGRGWSPCFLL